MKLAESLIVMVYLLVIALFHEFSSKKHQHGKKINTFVLYLKTAQVLEFCNFATYICSFAMVSVAISNPTNSPP